MKITNKKNIIKLVTGGAIIAVGSLMYVNGVQVIDFTADFFENFVPTEKIAEVFTSHYLDHLHHLHFWDLGKLLTK